MPLETTTTDAMDTIDPIIPTDGPTMRTTPIEEGEIEAASFEPEPPMDNHLRGKKACSDTRE